MNYSKESLNTSKKSNVQIASNSNDYALVIGLTHYQHFPSLIHSASNSGNFIQWLVSQEGGKLKDSHIFSLTSAHP